MFKIIYLPDPEIPVYHISRRTYDRTVLDAYVTHKSYYFYMAFGCIHSGIFSSKDAARLLAPSNRTVIKKHLLEVIEVPNV